MKPLPRLYAIADASFGDPVRLTDNLFKGGARLVQVRNKKGSTRELLNQVDCILSLAPDGAKLIVNDRTDVALVARAGGVHLGQADLPPAKARQILGPGPMIGISTHNKGQALEAEKLPVDYIAVGPIFSTTSKENPDPVIGLESLAEICKAIRKPVVAIGGIKLENVVGVLQAGASSVAVIRDVLDAPDIASRVQRWIEALNQWNPTGEV
jgi:thiamine-phosphate pyrophosphorylase